MDSTLYESQVYYCDLDGTNLSQIYRKIREAVPLEIDDNHIFLEETSSEYNYNKLEVVGYRKRSDAEVEQIRKNIAAREQQRIAAEKQQLEYLLKKYPREKS